jgi:hypothetical protein
VPVHATAVYHVFWLFMKQLIARWMHSQNQNFSELVRFLKLKKHSKMAKKRQSNC